MFHIVLDPLLLRVGAGVLIQFGPEAVGEKVPAQLDGDCEAFPQEMASSQEEVSAWTKATSGSFASLRGMGQAPTKAISRV